MTQTNWEADKMLDVYIYDYLVKRNMHASAKAFQSEGKVSSEPVAIDAPGGFLFEWWSVFWDIFIARTNEKRSDAAASYLETQLIKAREQEQQQPQPQQMQRQPQQQQQQQQLQMQQLLLQRRAQQQLQEQQQQLQPRQLRNGGHILDSHGISVVGSSEPLLQHPGLTNALASKIYEDRLKLHPQRDSAEEASMRMQSFGESVGQILDPSQSSTLKPVAPTAALSGQLLHGAAGVISGALQQVQTRGQQLAGPIPELKPEIHPALNPRTSGSDGSLIGIAGPNMDGNNLTLKGWPLTGLDQFRSGILQQQKPLMESSQPLNQLQFLNPQQRQLLLQAQPSLASPSGDIDSRRLEFLLNRNVIIGRDVQTNSVPNVGSPIQTSSSGLPRADTDMLIKKIAQLQQQQQLLPQSNIQQQLQLQNHAVSSQRVQSSNSHQHQQDKMGPNSISVERILSNTLHGNDQASKNLGGRKRKQPGTSSGPANSSGTANTLGPSPSSAPSTPSTHTAGDVMSVPGHSESSSKPLLVFPSDDTGPLTSPGNQLAHIDHFVQDGSLDDNVESFLSHDETDARDRGGGASADGNKGFAFTEVGFARASTSKVVSCHFSSDGKLLATGGHDKKVVLWYPENLKPKSTLEEHSLMITDVRFSPVLPRLATSSFDKTVRIWDVDNPGFSLRTFTGHSASVMSLDFHPNKEDLVCSCDGDGEVRYWSINNGSCTRVFKGGVYQIRFQPRFGKYFAAAVENIVSVLDVETQACLHTFQGHAKHVSSICWDPFGEYVASVSEDLVRVWSLGSGSHGECVHDLKCVGNKFHSCVFHPAYPSLLVIGCYQTLELWDMAEGKTMTLAAHEGLIAALTASNSTGMMASASHDKFIKLWK